MIALVGGSVVALTGYLTVDGPSAVVTKYFAALSRGDAQTALGYGPAPAGDRSWLTAQVLRDQRSGGAITAISAGAPVAGAVPVTYQLAGVRVTDTVPVVQRNGRWQLVASAVPTTVTIAQAAHRATFAGAAVPTARVLLFAGPLPVQFDAAALRVQPGSGVVRFAGGGGTKAAVEITASGRATISTAVNAALVACLTDAVPVATCPLPAGPGIRAIPQSLHGQLTGTPTVDLSVAAQADGKIMITGQAELKATYKGLDYENQPVSRSSPAEITFLAHCYATDPTKIIWDVS